MLEQEKVLKSDLARAKQTEKDRATSTAAEVKKLNDTANRRIEVLEALVKELKLKAGWIYKIFL
jgi:hypothetical protein